MVVRPPKYASQAWFLGKEPGFVLILRLLAALAIGCDQKQSNPEGKTRPVSVTGITTTFEDEVRGLPGDQIAWSTYWKFCWDAYPGAESYELQIITSEGASPRLKNRKAPCYRIQMATGVNARQQGMLDRAKLLELQIGQFSYRVRAVLGNNQYSEWSPAITMKPVAN